jgi:hypothetical protein
VCAAVDVEASVDGILAPFVSFVGLLLPRGLDEEATFVISIAISSTRGCQSTVANVSCPGATWVGTEGQRRV